MGTEYSLALLATACYAASSLLAVLSLFADKPRDERAVLALMAAGGAVLAAALAVRGAHAEFVPIFSRFDALGVYVLALTVSTLALAACRTVRGVTGILTPYATLFLLLGLPGLRPGVEDPAPGQGPWLGLHVATAFLAYGVFTLAALHAAIYLLQDGNLKHKRFGVVWQRLPSLETLDQVMSRLAGIAFLLLTSSIVLGVVMVRATGGGDKWFTDPKVIATVVTWFLLAVFVHMRANSGRHGRGIALMAVMTLAWLLFSFIGIHLVAPSLHAFLVLGGGEAAP